MFRFFQFLFISAFLFCCSASIYAATPSLETPVPTYTGIKGKTYFLSLTLRIPADAYIYGNPKGPGTGKPLEIRTSSASCRIDTPLIEKPLTYYPKGDDVVYIYRNKVNIIVPFSIISDSRENISLSLSGLMCTNSTCTPFSITKSFSFDESADHSVFTSAPPPEMIQLGKEIFPARNNLSMNSNASQIRQSGRIFTPRFFSSNISGIWYALLMGIAAGFILNFMPCVFPVLGIKLSGIVQESHNNSIIRTGFFYTAGILFSFLILAGLASFAGYRWGSLFQKSGFLIIIILIIVSFALSLFGVFEINIPGFTGKAAAHSFKNKNINSFLQGLLAAILSTPCSGPLLGSTLAWAFTQPPAVIFAVFSAIGVGMAFPYIIVAFFPRLLFFIPKPGNWMIVFKQLLGFLLIGSAIFFLNALNEQLFIPVLSMLLIAAIGIWQFGYWGNITRPFASRIVSFSILVLLFSAALYWPLSMKPNVKTESLSAFSFTKLDSNFQNGKISIVIFTADWCTNCKFVEQSVLRSNSIQTLFKDKKVSILIADITEKGTQGEVLLTQLHSVSIPFLAVFPAGKTFEQPICLRDIYTQHDIIKALSIAETESIR